MELLSPREWAILTWGALIFVWAVLNEDIRQSLWSIAASLRHWKISSLMLVVLAYVGGIAYFYDAVGFGYDRLWVDAALWSIYGIYLVGRFITRREYSHVAGDVVRENMRGAAFLELIGNTYTFSYLVELVLVPAIVFVSMLGAVAHSNMKYKRVGRITDWLLAAIGFNIFAFAVGQAIADPETLRNLGVVFAVAFPVVLALGFTPLIYLALVASHYKQIFMRLDMGVSKSPHLKRRAKWEIIKVFGLSYRKLNSFVGPKSAALMRATSLDAVRELLPGENESVSV